MLNLLRRAEIGISLLRAKSSLNRTKTGHTEAISRPITILPGLRYIYLSFISFLGILSGN